MKSEEEMRNTLTRVYRGSMLPSIHVVPEQFDELFDIALACVADVTGASEEELMGRSRVQPCCTYRFMLYKLMRHEVGDAHTGPSLSWIGNKMGRDHGTIIHGIDQIETYLESDRRVEPIYMRVLTRFEIARAEYVSMVLDEASSEQITGLKEAAATIAKAIKKHEDHLASVMEQLARAKLKEDDNENMVQDKCPSDG